eukprot:snap_masked-scaffold_64-processed-gene-0.37-mRNA-1 protein AED:0.39 eAED:0.40 QI:0/0/0/1/1/1/2/0/1625
MDNNEVFSEKARMLGAFIVEDDIYEPETIFAIRASDNMKKMELKNKSNDDKIKEFQELNHAENDPVFIDSIERDVNVHLKKEQGFGENIDLRSEEEEKLFLERDEQDVLKAIDAKIQEISGLDEGRLSQLKDTLLRNSRAFGLKSSPARMSRMDPIICFLKDEKAEIISQPRWMGLHKMEVLRNKLKSMVDRELIRPTKNPMYGSPAFLVPKPGRPGEWRMVVDMKLLNSHTRKTPLIMPNLEQQVSFTKGATVFGSFDILSGFDYLPVAENSRKYFTIVTYFGCYEMCGSPQGWVNTPQLFQNRMLTDILRPLDLFAKTSNGVIQWIDDTLLFSESFEKYILLLDAFLNKLTQLNLRLNISKCSFYDTEAIWCGRTINRFGWRFSEKYYNKILETPRPTFAHELAQVLYLCNWLGPSIPRLAELRDFFSPMLPAERSMKELKKMNITLEWNPELELRWEELLKELNESSKRNMAQYSKEMNLCVFMDASIYFWAFILTSCENANPADDDCKVALEDQVHSPLFFLSGPQIGWHISAKELYPLVHVFKRLPYLILGQDKRLTVFTDHRNLIFILHPEWNPKTAYLDRLYRWSLLFQQVDMTVRHIPGKKNVLADLVSRWGNPGYPQHLESIDSGKTNSLGIVATLSGGTFNEKELDKGRISFLNPYYIHSWEKISYSDVLEAQKEANIVSADSVERDLKYKNGKLIIPTSLVIKLMLHNHLANNHASIKEEERTLQSFKLKLPKGTTTLDLIKRIRNNCLHCGVKSKLIRRSLNMSPLSKIPREIIHADFLYINKFTHYLVLTDNATRKIYLRHCTSDTAEIVATALLEFVGNFQLLENFTLYTDNGSYFAGRVLEEISKLLKFTRSFSVQFAPWTNGTAEISNSKIIRVIRSLRSEFRLYEEEIGKLTGVIMNVINNSPSTIKAGYSPNELFLNTRVLNGIEMLLDEDTIYVPMKNEVRRPKNIDTVINKCLEIRRLWESKLNEAYELTKLRRDKQNNRMNDRFRPSTLQFMPSEWVLCSKAGTLAARDKTKPIWIGPYKVIKSIHRNTYLVTDLLGKDMIVHASRLWPYAPPEFEPAEQLVKLFQVDKADLEVEKLLDVQFEQRQWWLLVKWYGFDEADNSWEPLSPLAEDIPEVVEDFLLEMNTKNSKRALKKFYSLTKKKASHSIKALFEGNPNYPTRSPGWLPIEKQILRILIAKFGCGNWSEMMAQNALPGKNKQQLITQAQKILFRQAIVAYKGIHLDIYRVGKANRSLSDKYIVNKTPYLDEFKLLRWCFNAIRFTLDDDILLNLKIPFFRRGKDLFTIEVLRNLEAIEEFDDFYPHAGSYEETLSWVWFGYEVNRALKGDEEQVIRWYNENKKDILERFKNNLPENTKLVQGLEMDFDQFHFTFSLRDRNIYEVEARNERDVRRATLYYVPDEARVLNADVLHPDFKMIYTEFMTISPTVIIMDPPWKIGSKEPTRGGSLNYHCFSDKDLLTFDFSYFQSTGFLLLWIVNSKRHIAEKMISTNGYKILDSVVWVKVSKQNKLQIGPGYYLRHASEICLLCGKGNYRSLMSHGQVVNVMFEQRRNHSQKPDAIYELAMKLVPKGPYLDVFARFSNVRSHWSSIGLEVTPSLTGAHFN